MVEMTLEQASPPNTGTSMAPSCCGNRWLNLFSAGIHGGWRLRSLQTGNIAGAIAIRGNASGGTNDYSLSRKVRVILLNSVALGWRGLAWYGTGTGVKPPGMGYWPATARRAALLVQLHYLFNCISCTIALLARIAWGRWCLAGLGVPTMLKDVPHQKHSVGGLASNKAIRAFLCRGDSNRRPH